MPKFLHTGEDLLSSLAVKEHLSLSAVDDSAVLWCHRTSIKYHMELSSKWRREARSVNNNSVVCHENILHLRFFICLLQLLTFVHQNHFAKIKVSILLLIWHFLPSSTCSYVTCCCRWDMWPPFHLPLVDRFHFPTQSAQGDQTSCSHILFFYFYFLWRDKKNSKSNFLSIQRRHFKYIDMVIWVSHWRAECPGFRHPCMTMAPVLLSQKLNRKS